MTTDSNGNTPLSPGEIQGLIPSLSTKQELNEWEWENILSAREWATATRMTIPELVSDSYVRKLHFRMFDQTWKWAGQYRKSEKNIGIPCQQIRESLAVLCGDVLFWIEKQIYPPDEIAVRFHYRLVAPQGLDVHAPITRILELPIVAPAPLQIKTVIHDSCRSALAAASPQRPDRGPGRRRDRS